MRHGMSEHVPSTSDALSTEHATHNAPQLTHTLRDQTSRHDILMTHELEPPHTSHRESLNASPLDQSHSTHRSAAADESLNPDRDYDHAQIFRGDSPVSSPQTSSLGPRRVTSLVSLMTTTLGASLIFMIAYVLGDSTPMYQLLLGGGATHLMSQACTTLLFFWGLGEALRLLIQLRQERAHLREVKPNAHDRRPLPALTARYSAEISRGISASKDYLEARDLVTATREGAIDQLASQERGIHAAMWLIPLSGFLGTVLGMSATIARFDELFNPASGGKLLGLAELAPAIQGLSTAFDTTLLALALVIPLKLILVLTQNRGERLAQDLESTLAAPLLDQLLHDLNTRSGRADEVDLAFDAEQLEAKLSQLNAQSSQLNRVIGETAETLGAVRDELIHNPAWSAHAQQEWRVGIERAISEGIAQSMLMTAQSQQAATLEVAIQHLAEQQQLIHQQMSGIQTALEAPLIIQRSHAVPAQPLDQHATAPHPIVEPKRSSRHSLKGRS